MLEFLRGKATERKLRLLACGVVRGHWDSLKDERSRGVVEVAERFADGLATEQEREAARKEACRTIYPDRPDVNCIALYSVENGEELFPNLVGVGTIEPGRLGSSVELWKDMAELLLDIFDNPFRRVALDRSWVTPQVVCLATRIYNQRAFGRVRILADALEEAGCDNAELFAHCRGPGPHVRGCWALDLFLGKE
jgi:hypothetical protein